MALAALTTKGVDAMPDVQIPINQAFPGIPDDTLSYGSGNRSTDKDWSIESGVTTFLKFRTMKSGEARFSVTDPNYIWNRHVLTIQLRDADGNFLNDQNGDVYDKGCDVGIGADVPDQPGKGAPPHENPVLEHDTGYQVALQHTGAPGKRQPLKLSLTKYYGPDRSESDPIEEVEDGAPMTMVINDVPGHWTRDTE